MIKFLPRHRHQRGGHSCRNQQRWNNTMAILNINGLEAKFELRDSVVHALRGIDLEIEEGEFFVLLGTIGLRQDHHAALHRRVGTAGRRRHLN